MSILLYVLTEGEDIAARFAFKADTRPMVHHLLNGDAPLGLPGIEARDFGFTKALDVTKRTFDVFLGIARVCSP
jgi:hypothetical protein